MTLSSTLFAASALAALALPARAGDLSAAAPEFAGICAAFGAGFQAIPGTETCLRISGSVAVESGYVGGSDTFRETSNAASRARGRVGLETRTPTDLGLLRSVIELDTAIGGDLR